MSRRPAALLSLDFCVRKRMIERMRNAIIVGVIVLGALSYRTLVSTAQRGEARVTPAEVTWPAAAAGSLGTSGAMGIQTVVLKGDPAKAGLYTLLLRAGPNMKIQSHSHQDDRVATVISGTWYFGYGRQFDEAALKALPPGSFYTEPPGVHHFAMTRGEGVVLQITGIGPSGTTYANPSNDPTKK